MEPCNGVTRGAQGMKVLLVDDDPLVLARLRELVAADGQFEPVANPGRASCSEGHG